MMQHLLHRFNCFSLFKAKKINAFLLWTMVGSLFVTYFIMYIYLPGEDEAGQWRVFFINNGLDLFAQSVIIFYGFKDTRNAGLATFWMVHCGILFFAAICGFNTQIFWFDIITKLFMLSLGAYIIMDIRGRSKNDQDVL